MVRESLNHQIKHLVSMQYSTVELRHQALEDVLAGPERAARRRCRPSSPRSTRSASSSPTRSSRPTPTRSRRSAARSRRSKGQDATEIPGRLVAAGHGRRWRRSGSCGRSATLSREYPEAELAAMDAKWYRLAPLRLRGRLDARRHLGGALPARPGAVPRPAARDRRDPRSGSTASGRGSPREYRDALGDDHLARGVGEDLRASVEPLRQRRRPSAAADGHGPSRDRERPHDAGAGRRGRLDADVAAGLARRRAAACVEVFRQPLPAQAAGARARSPPRYHGLAARACCGPTSTR